MIQAIHQEQCWPEPMPLATHPPTHLQSLRPGGQHRHSAAPRERHCSAHQALQRGLLVLPQVGHSRLGQAAAGRQGEAGRKAGRQCVCFVIKLTAQQLQQVAENGSMA